MTAVLDIGPETHVNTVTTNDQMRPAIATLQDGSYVITWDSYGQDGSAEGIYFQHYSAEGARIGGEIRANSTTTNGQRDPSIAATDDGGFVIVWAGNGSGDANGIFAQRFSAAGTAIGGETNVVTSSGNFQAVADVAALAGGGFVVSWESLNQEVGQSNYGVFSQAFDASGFKFGGEIQVNTTTVNDQHSASVAGLADGSYIVVWSSVGQNGGLDGIYSQRLSANGSPMTAETLVNTTTTGNQETPTVVALASGGYVVAWEGSSASDSAGIFMRFYGSSGNPLGGDTIVETAIGVSQHSPALAALDDGGFMVTWDAPADSSGYGVYAQRYDEEGNAVGPETRINATTSGDQFVSAVAGLHDGGFAVAWQSNPQEGFLTGIYSRAYTTADTTVGVQVLYGTGDADRLDGGSGADLMYGGGGDDTYVVSATLDSVSEVPGQGYDTVESAINWALGFAVENLTLTGSAPITGTGNDDSNVIIGNNGANAIHGAGGSDTVASGLGNDSVYGENGDDYLDGEGGNDYMEGGFGDDYMSGGAGKDTEFGGDGNDSLYGGDGDDQLSADTGNDTVHGGDGNDVIYSSSGTDTLSGDGGEDTYNAGGLVASVNASLSRGTASQGGYTARIYGFEDIHGSSVNDILAGDTNANIIDGGTGGDAMAGSLGDDSYIVDDLGDTVTESSNVEGGYDMVTSSVDFTLGNYIEKLVLTGTNDLSGNGNSFSNVIIGNDGANFLDGKVGSDTLTGGYGDDTYWVDVAGDVVVEQAEGGTDTVRAGLSWSLGTYFENLVLTGTGNFDGTGNADANSLTGNAGNNVLNGVAGADTLAGGKGDDTYFVDNTGDNVVEADGEGTDIINASVTYSLSGRFVETLWLTGSAAINATGNSRANTLVGNSGANTLNGGGGNDSLTGGLGADIFLFSGGSGADTINDFASAQGDTINAHAYNAVSHNVIQSGSNVVIDFGGGNTITVLNDTVADVTAHTMF